MLASDTVQILIFHWQVNKYIMILELLFALTFMGVIFHKGGILYVYYGALACRLLQYYNYITLITLIIISDHIFLFLCNI